MIAFWDFLTAVLVVFPLLTGGIWIKRPGLFIELSDMSVPVIVVTALAVLIRFYLKKPLEKSFFFRLGAALWERWCAALEKSPARTLFAGWIFFAFLLGLSALRRHHAFESSSWDLGIYHNAIWNFVHGKWLYLGA